jgi:hypothetical protein
MKTLIVIVLLVGFVTTSQAADSEKPKTTTVKVPDGATFDITPSEGWAVEIIEPKRALAPTVSLSTPNHEATLEFGFIKGASATNGKQKTALKKIAQPFVEGSVEKKLNIEKLESKDATCLFAEFTNPDLLNKLTESGYYKVVGIGVIASDNTMVCITLYGVSLTDKSYLAGKELIRTGIKARK